MNYYIILKLRNLINKIYLINVSTIKIQKIYYEINLS